MAFPVLSSFEPNSRPLVSPQPDLASVEALVARNDLVKPSEEDAAFLLPGLSLEAVPRRWRTLGPRLVMIARGVGLVVA